MPSFKKHLYTVQEACDALSIGRTSIYNAIREEKLVAKKYGSKTLITAESIEQWIADLHHAKKHGGQNV